MISTPLGPPISTVKVEAYELFYADDCFCLRLEDGRVISTPLAWFRTLDDASEEQLQRGKIDPDGKSVSWDNLNEHLSVECLLSPSPLYRDEKKGPINCESIEIKVLKSGGEERGSAKP